MNGQMELNAMPSPIRWSTERLALMLSLTERRINQLIIEGIIPNPGHEGHDPEKAIAGYLNFVRRSGSDKPNVNALVRKLTAEAELCELKVARQKQELISTDTIGRIWEKQIMNCRSRLLAIPKKLAPTILSCRTSAQAEGVLKKAVYDALTELSLSACLEEMDQRSTPADPLTESGKDAPSSEEAKIGKAKKRTRRKKNKESADAIAK